MSTKDELKRKLEIKKSLLYVAQEDARQKTKEAGDAVRLAERIAKSCAKIDEDIQEGDDG